jgi:cell division protein ZipA
MGPFRWVLLLIGTGVIGLIFAYSRGWLPGRKSLNKLSVLRKEPVLEGFEEDFKEDLEEDFERQAQPEAEEEPAITPDPATLPDPRVITVRIMPAPGTQFPAEELVLALREAGLRHGDFGIFHRLTSVEMSAAKERIRYSVASLVEPGSFDLTNLKESEYRGISIFMLLPAPEDAVQLFDEMLATAREIARRIDGRLLDERGGALSIQRERYMREEVIEFLRQYAHSAIVRSYSAEA